MPLLRRRKRDAPQSRRGIIPIVEVGISLVYGATIPQQHLVDVVELEKTGALSKVRVVQGSKYDRRAFRKKLNGSWQPTSSIVWQ